MAKDIPGESIDQKQLIAELLAALEESEVYVTGAYECAFPNTMENESVAAMVAKAIADAKAYLNPPLDKKF